MCDFKVYGGFIVANCLHILIMFDYDLFFFVFINEPEVFGCFIEID